MRSDEEMCGVGGIASPWQRRSRLIAAIIVATPAVLGRAVASAESQTHPPRSSLLTPQISLLAPRMFFSFDGIDGVGKSTQLRMFCEWLAAAGRDPVVCRDPGSTPLGEQIRGI